jgi:hypothetical protein
LGLALDEPGADDETVNVGEVTFILDDDLRTMMPDGSTVNIHYDVRWQRFFVSANGRSGEC